MQDASSIEHNSVKDYLSILLKPRFWGKDCKKVKLVQTHTSWVFLTGTYAYKIKKPVFFGFLDYTTLSLRKKFSYEEFKINQILAPDIYFGVIPILKKGNKIFLGSEDTKSHEVIDYAIKMRELPQDAIMTNLLLNKKLGFSPINEIARIIANFHKKSRSREGFYKYGSIETIKYNWDENFVQTEPFIGVTLTKNKFEKIKSAVEEFIKNNKYLFIKRIYDQKIIKCHGDLHSENIFVVDKVYIFDSLEFNPRFAVSDTASEVAFLAMDLEFYNHKHLADFFLDRYLFYTNDWELLRLLDFYKCYRAYVRGKVTSFLLNDSKLTHAEKNKIKLKARKYFDLAESYSDLFNRKLQLIMVMGLPGSGKTYIAERVAQKLGAHYLSTDIIRKEITNTPIEEHRFEGYGKGIYRADISQKTYAELYRRSYNYLAGGISCVVDGTFAWESSRIELQDIASKTKAQFFIVHCTCPEKIILSRLKRRPHTASVSDATPEIYFRIRDYFEPVKERQNYLEINTAKSVRENLLKIIKFINKTG
ncbi:MAG: AAA family ATPase [candidate division WOR-3 bacterium]|nr:AAA family ATPase [candidate division WOR-3 bacterium]MDW7987902.1 AAA family ATPase [candidate division WOR-3 bacterium]